MMKDRILSFFVSEAEPMAPSPLPMGLHSADLFWPRSASLITNLDFYASTFFADIKVIMQFAISGSTFNEITQKCECWGCARVVCLRMDSREGRDVRICRAFENEVNIAVHASRAAYEGMLFRFALKAAWYDLQVRFFFWMRRPPYPVCKAGRPQSPSLRCSLVSKLQFLLLPWMQSNDNLRLWRAWQCLAENHIKAERPPLA